MPTCRVIIADALRALKATAPGDDPSQDELIVGLEAFQNLVNEIHAARGPMADVDITSATYTANENQRVRVQAGDTAQIILPNAIPLYQPSDPYDYGFAPRIDYPAQGTTGVADGVEYRQPRDGTRIEIVGVTNALYFYRADTNSWMPAYGLTLDSEIPFSAVYAGALGAMTADRLMEPLAIAEPTAGLLRRIQRAQLKLMMRTNANHDPVVVEYF